MRIRRRAVRVVQATFRTARASAHELAVDVPVNAAQRSLGIDFDSRFHTSPFLLRQLQSTGHIPRVPKDTQVRMVQPRRNLTNGDLARGGMLPGSERGDQVVSRRVPQARPRSHGTPVT